MLKKIKLMAIACTSVAAIGVLAGPAHAYSKCEKIGTLEMSEHSLLTNLQEAFVLRGYDAGEFDGIYGPKTRGAIVKYQRDHKMVVTGCPTKDLLEHVKMGVPYSLGYTHYHKYDAPVIAHGPVADVQQELTSRGYYLGVVDGLMGPKTRKAIRRFQADAGWKVTGYLTSEQFQLMQQLRPSVRGDGLDTRFVPDKVKVDLSGRVVQ